MSRTKIIACFIALLILGPVYAIERYVPQNYPTIEAAIDACYDLDTVIIAPGQYTGPGNRNLDFKGKEITVRGSEPTDPQTVQNTIIDCEGKGRAFVFQRAENHNTSLEGLTIINGYASLGAAIYCYNKSGPLIKNCVLRNNSGFWGGAIACANNDTQPKIINCIIVENSALSGGGGIYSNAASPVIKNCVIANNQAPNGAGIYYLYPSEPVITNCTIISNQATRLAGGIYCYKSTTLILNNSILWANSAINAQEILVGAYGDGTLLKIAYCDIQNPAERVICLTGSTILWLDGNISIAPDFDTTANISTNEEQTYLAVGYHLLDSSPCIDMGDPKLKVEPDETDIDGEQRISGEGVDIGADEYQAVIEAQIRITPRTLNLASKGNFINCSIELPETYDIESVLPESITLNEEINILKSNIDEDSKKMNVKFSRADVENNLLGEEGMTEIKVQGKLNTDADFEGTDTIRIIKP